MSIIESLHAEVLKAIKNIYDVEPDADKIIISHTKREFEGEFTLVTFPLAKMLRQNPNQIGETIGAHLKEHIDDVISFNIAGGFLNLSMNNRFWLNTLESLRLTSFPLPRINRKIMVEYASPNTNKPLHLGHIRNILLGWSCSEMYHFVGYEVVRTQIVNDRGVAICKSMLAWEKFGEGESPETSKIKGDHLVGKYYVRFNQELDREYSEWQTSDTAQELFGQQDDHSDQQSFYKAFSNQYFNEYSSLGREVRDMLLRWEDGDQETVDLWRTMNAWVYEGFNRTYGRLGVLFDITYYESNTYLLGKESIAAGLEIGVFYKKDDGSVWIDLTDVGMDHKIVLRADGTSVYMTQDIGTAQMRYKEHGFEKMVYVVGDEQDYHFSVLFEILKRLNEPYADQLYHLSYGMVDLPTGKMKSREGTVVDADDLIDEVVNLAEASAKERGELDELAPGKQAEIINRIALGALKFFIIKVNPKKRMVFNPAESLDMQGQTGPYVQNAFVRIQSILRKAQEVPGAYQDYPIRSDEKDLLGTLLQFVPTVEQAAHAYDPSSVANYAYNLARAFHRYYHDVRILNAETNIARGFRLDMIREIGRTLAQAFKLLGIQMPDRM